MIKANGWDVTARGIVDDELARLKAQDAECEALRAQLAEAQTTIQHFAYNNRALEDALKVATQRIKELESVTDAHSAKEVE